MKPYRAVAILTTLTTLSIVSACGSDEASETVDDVVTSASSVVDAVIDESTDSDTTSDSTSDSSTETTALDADERVDQVSSALADGDFTTMLELLELSGVADDLEGRAVTILAPTDEAFTSLSSADLAELLSDPTSIDDILERHIIEGVLTYDELAAASDITTLAGDSLTIEASGDDITIGGATVIRPVDELAGEDGQEVAVFGIDRILVDGE